jgi:phenylpropionate dioxygenase-like ring-hydroxylating dioxygenase large terminal subunit
MMSSPEFPLNCWWVAATSAEVGRKPLARRLLDRNVVLFRRESGTVIALEDRCPHRGAPLSRGRVLGDVIACAYHGFRFDGTGRCTHIPTQHHIPSTMATAAWPTIEYGPFVWIWMGDARQADPAKLPQINWSTDPAHMRFARYTVKRFDWVALHENFMDLPHIFFLHNMDKDWLGYGDSPQDLQAATTLDETPRGLVRTTRQPNSDPLALDMKTLGMEAGQKVDCVDTVFFLPPGCYIHEEACEWVSHTDHQHRSYGFQGLHCTTPVSAGSCHWWWVYTYDYGHEALHEYQARWDFVLGEEDAGLLEAMQVAKEQDADRAIPSEILVMADQAPMRVRRILADMAAAERNGK